MVIRNDVPRAGRRPQARRGRAPAAGARHPLLGQACALQEGLQRLARHLLALQDGQRGCLGRILQDEVCQLLVGINLHLLQLQQAVRGSNLRLDAGLADTRRLVARSASSARHRINRRTRHP